MRQRSIAILATMVMALSAFAIAAPAAAGGDPPGGAAYVALGDSEAAGTGHLPYVDRTCLRSRHAYPAQLGAMLGASTVNVSCAGASTDDVITAQLAPLGSGTRLVTITAGINDLEWQRVLLACRSGGDPGGCAQAKAVALAAIADLPASVGQMLAAVRMRAPNAQILLTGYPLLFGDLTAGVCRAGSYQGTRVVFTAAETRFANAALEGVNDAIFGGLVAYVNAAADEGVSFVDAAAHFDGHGLCDVRERWISPAKSGRLSDRTFHLNARGMREYAAMLAEVAIPIP